MGFNTEEVGEVEVTEPAQQPLVTPDPKPEPERVPEPEREREKIPA